MAPLCFRTGRSAAGGGAGADRAAPHSRRLSQDGAAGARGGGRRRRLPRGGRRWGLQRKETESVSSLRQTGERSLESALPSPRHICRWGLPTKPERFDDASVLKASRAFGGASTVHLGAGAQCGNERESIRVDRCCAAEILHCSQSDSVQKSAVQWYDPCCTSLQPPSGTAWAPCPEARTSMLEANSGARPAQAIRMHRSTVALQLKGNLGA